MPFATRLFGSALAVLVVSGALSSVAAADPDIDSESASAVITELKEQGYDVRIKGVSGDDTDMLTTCSVTSINDSGEDSPDPTKTTLIYVDVACPIQHS
jgi:hypothetical protein